MRYLGKTLSIVLVLIFLTSLVMLQPATVKAQAKTITVPDDYPTIASAIENANNGDTIFIKAGNYSGPMYQTLTISKSLSIIGEGADSTKINLLPSFNHTEYDTMKPDPTKLYHMFEKPNVWDMIRVHINTTTWDASLIIDANDFVISSISITSLGDALINGDRNQITKSNIIVPHLSLNGSHLSIKEDSINSPLTVNGSYSAVSKNSLYPHGYDISIYGSYLNISDNTVLGNINLNGEYCKVSENNGGGFTIQGSHVEISRNNVNTVNIDASDCFVHENSAGLGIGGDGNIIAENIVDHSGITLCGSNNSIYANELTNNRKGLDIEGKSNIIYANNIENNTWGIDVGYDSATIYQNNFVNNSYQVSTIKPMSQPFFFDNGSIGNYWSDYGESYLDKNDIVDKPYVIGDNRSDRYPLMVPFDISKVNITVPVWVTAYSSILSPTPSPPQPKAIGNSEPFTTNLAIASVAIIAVVSAGLIVYFKKRKKHTIQET